MKEKILILVKTYPTFSKTYFELVCTAGINENGEWRRIYPVPFRDLDEKEQYSKYQYVEVEIEKNNSDPRPESYKLIQSSIINSLEKIDTKQNWQKRKDILFKNTKIFDNLEDIITRANKANELSLVIFKPHQIIDFVIEYTDREWSIKTLDYVQKLQQQPALFPELECEITLAKKLPYKFSYQFVDVTGKESTLMIEDWELGALYWNCLKKANGDEQIALSKVKEQYFDNFVTKKDLYLFLGTTRQFHGWAHNPFIIIGIFYPPKENQGSLF